jgi:ATP-dependent helicase HrpB
MLKAWQRACELRFDVAACADLGLHAQTARRVGLLRDQLIGIARDLGLDGQPRPVTDADLLRCVLAGFSDQVARRVSPGSARWEMVHRRRGTLDRESVVRGGEYLVATEVHERGRIGGDVEVHFAQASRIEEAWLREMYPEDFSEARTAAYDPVQKRVLVTRTVLFRELALRHERAGDALPDEAAAALAEEVFAARLTLKTWDHAVEQWIARVNLLAEHCVELGIPAITAAARRDIVRDICAGAMGYKDLREKPVWPAVRGWLSAAQRAWVDAHAPERLALPNGRTPRVTYETGKPPFIALRVQELYGVDRPLNVAMGRVRVVVHVLAPNQRPVQITDDLGSFWRNGYEQVKKDLRGRYPKHEWR